MHNAISPLQGFASTGLSPAILSVLERNQFTTPTPIQAQAIPVALQGKDIIGIAQTGTGKTMAFGLPILQRLMANAQERALVVVPTRELALQVEENIKKISRGLNPAIRSISLIGGMPMYRQVRDLKAKPRLIVATPGRLRDHMEQRTINLADVRTLVLDEADRMLDMGFAPQITYICQHLPSERQTLLFSATLAPEIAALAKNFQHDPERIEIARAGTSSAQIRQELCYVGHNEKVDRLRDLLDTHQGTVLVFSRTKHGASKLSKKVNELGHRAAEIHSNRSLGQRRHALDGFKNGRYRVLVATDVASRGIDVHNIGLVINYDLPDASEDYVHRIGRTGRAGKEGHAISFATPDQRRNVVAIERLIGKQLPLSALSAAVAAPRREESRNTMGRPSRQNRHSRPNRNQQSAGPRAQRQDYRPTDGAFSPMRGSASRRFRGKR